jgi:predicted metalloprotease with PDZ domain
MQRFIKVEAHIPLVEAGNIYFEIAAWRPGRYEEQNYSKNIRGLYATNDEGEALACNKISKNKWCVAISKASCIVLRYEYYAFQMDAGGCWLDDSMLYLNPIACVVYPSHGFDRPCSISFDFPPNFKLACGQQANADGVIRFDHFTHFFDSPLIIAENIQTVSYVVQHTPFYIHLQGVQHLEIENLVEDFKKFTQKQLEVFGGFPFQDYHFLFIFLPYNHYHGVEHSNSSVIVLGQNTPIQTKDSLYQDLLGIASHELLHAWNICKIRPKELIPYRFSTAQLFDTGFVAEGFTTYLGDKYLSDAGVYSAQQYKNELNTMLYTHFCNYGNRYYSLAQSSLDLWVDGYIQHAPFRKVSIYHKGAVVAWLFDLYLAYYSNHQYKLDTVMRILWDKYLQDPWEGYTSELIKSILVNLAGERMKELFQECIYQSTDLIECASHICSKLGIKLEAMKVPACMKLMGMRISYVNEHLYKVEQIAPNAPASLLAVGEQFKCSYSNLDELNQAIEETKSIVVQVLRKEKLITIELHSTEETYFQGLQLA